MEARVHPLETPVRAVPVAAQTVTARSRVAAVAAHGVFVPQLLLSVALLGWIGSQQLQLWTERSRIARDRASLEAQHQGAVKVRASLDAVATATAALAAQGNANARVIVDELRRRGVTIHPNGASKPP